MGGGADMREIYPVLLGFKPLRKYKKEHKKNLKRHPDSKSQGYLYNIEKHA